MITYKRYFNSKFISPAPAGKDVFEGLAETKHFWANSVRTGLFTIFEKLGIYTGDSIMLPAFSPHGLVLPARKKGINIVYYKLNRELGPEIDDLEKRVNKIDNVKAIFVIHYFGYRQNLDPVIEFARREKIFILEDYAHSLVHNFNFKRGESCNTGDISFFSLPKLLPVPDGSLFVINNVSLDFSTIEYHNSFLNRIARICNYLQLLYRTKQYGAGRTVSGRIYSLLCTIFNTGYYLSLCNLNKTGGISNLSLKILQRLNIHEIVKARISNVSHVISALDLKKLPVLFSSDPSVVITGIPFFSERKNEIIKKLHDCGINALSYSKYWWFVPEELSNEFESEKRLHDFHFLIPLNENMTEGEREFLIDSITKIINDEHTH